MYINTILTKIQHGTIKIMIKYMVIGDPVSHSRSPGMQNAAFEACGLGSPYGRRHVTFEELPEFVRFARENLAGVNLTVPHKAAVIPLIDRVDPEAAAAGSVNTLVIENGEIFGTSTDGYGLEHALLANFHRPVQGAAFCFVGAGGAAHATAFHLAGCGARAIRLANRTVAKAEELADRLRRRNPELLVETAGIDDTEQLARWFSDTDFLIQATSLGLRPDDPSPFPLELLHRGLKLALFDTIYRETPLLKRAGELALPCAGGMDMLIYQGAKSFEIWTGLTAPIEAMRRGFLEARPC